MFFPIENTVKKYADRMKRIYHYSNILIQRLMIELSRSFSEKPCQLTFQLIIPNTTTFDPDSIDPSIAISDFNGDGYLDMAVTTCLSYNVDILLGIGDGTFGESTTFSIEGDCPSAIAVGDFNSDGYMDVAIADYFYNIVVLLGNGDGTLGTPMILSNGDLLYLCTIAISDYNGDSHLDLAVASCVDSGIFVMLGNNDGTFGTSTTFCTNACNGLSSLTTDDFNGDGRVDLVASSESENTVFILLNDGNGYFGIITSYFTGSFSTPKFIAVGDFNNDNRSDLAIANSGRNNIGIMLGNGNGDFGVQITFSTGVFSSPYAIAIGDFNGDDQLDLAVTNQDAENVGILLGIGNGTFLTPITFSTGAGSFPDMIVSGDFNRDGKLDLIVTDVSSNIIRIFLNTCNCCISELTTESQPIY
jgi:hypothetical protein